MPEELFVTTFGMGIVIALVLSELLGITAGGIVVPGYLALETGRPIAIIGTLVIAFATFAVIRFFSNFMFLYGRRRFVVTLLIAILLNYLALKFLSAAFQLRSFGFITLGNIIPGFIASWMDTQGVVKTVSALVYVLVIISLIAFMIQGSLDNPTLARLIF